MLETTTDQKLVMTELDYERLIKFCAHSSASVTHSILKKLAPAEVIGVFDVPRDLVTMNSEIVFDDEETDKEYRFKLVYPRDFKNRRHQVSVLSPLGLELLGMSVGETIEWRDRSGRAKRLKLVRIDYQPEAFGDRHL